jgi:hypothetical protein
MDFPEKRFEEDVYSARKERERRTDRFWYWFEKLEPLAKKRLSESVPPALQNDRQTKQEIARRARQIVTDFLWKRFSN